MEANQLDNEKNMRGFLIKKYILEILMIAIILSFIFVCRYNGFIDNCVTGTLLGTVIGYFASSIRKLHDK